MAFHAVRDLGNPLMGLTGRYLGIFLAGDAEEKPDDRKNEDRKDNVISHVRFYHTGEVEILYAGFMIKFMPSKIAPEPAEGSKYFLHIYLLR
jgi:hypothetical protein